MLIMVLAVCLAGSGCSGRAPEPDGGNPEDGGSPEDGGPEPAVEGCAILHEPEFGGVYIEIPIDEFNALGFEYGDSVKVVFSNGYTLEDIPYYNGYYVDAGEPLLIAYPGYDYIKAAINYGEDLWDKGGLYASLGPGEAVEKEHLVIFPISTLEKIDNI